MFCPFVNNDCVADCIFNNGCFEEQDSENCNLMDAIRNIQSDGFVERTPKDYLDNIENLLKSIEYNTGNDNTESNSINSKLDDIINKLDEIKDKL